MSMPPDRRVVSASPLGPLRPEFPVWGLFGRGLLVVLGHILIVPSPWTSTSFYKFLTERIALPDGRRLKFAGQPGDIWYAFIAFSVLTWLHPSLDRSGLPQAFGLALMLASWALMVLILKWFCTNVRSEDGRLSLSFEGGYWAYIGWNILLIVSFVTIVGWAWVTKYMVQWICRNVRGTLSFDFTATGWEILWRTLVFLLASMLVIPIPWMIRWYADWMISQISVIQPGAAAATA